MPARPNFVLRQTAKLLKFVWFRELIFARSSAPEGVSYTESTQSEEKDGRSAKVSGTKNASLFVTDIEQSKQFFIKLIGLKELKTGDPVPHPYESGRTVQVCAMGFGNTPDLMLVRQRDASGSVIPVTDNGLHHVAFWIESIVNINDFARELRRKGIPISYGPVKHYPGPGGDGGWGGNHAVYVNDPDGHFIELHNDMDPFGTRYPLRGQRS